MTEFPFSKIVQEIEDEIGSHYEGRIINWTDDNYDNAWSKLLDQFDAILKTKDRAKIDAFGQMYRTQALGYIRLYKKAHAQKKADAFMDQLKAGKLPPRGT